MTPYWPSARPSGNGRESTCTPRAYTRLAVFREIDLVSYGGLKPKLDDDIRREAVLL